MAEAAAMAEGPRPARGPWAMGQPAARARAVRLCQLHVAWLGVLYLGLALGPELTAPEAQPLIAGRLMVLTIAWIAGSWILATGTIFSPYLILLASATAFNGGQVILSVAGLLPAAVLGGNHEPGRLAAAILFVGCGLGWLHLGALVCLCRVPDPTRAPAWMAPWQPSSPNLVRVARVIAVIAVPAFLWYTQRTLGLVLKGGYHGLYQSGEITGAARYIKVLGAFLVPASLYLIAAARNRRDRYLGLLLIVFNTLLWLSVGSRGELGGPLLAVLWLWDRRVKSITRVGLIAGALVLVIGVFPLLGAIRGLRGAEKFSGRALELAAQVDNPAVAIFTEMGASLQVLAYTMEAVPAYEPHDYGLTYLEALGQLAPVPYRVRPTLGHWITPLIQPYWYAIGGGMGGSFFGEVYYSFGWVGMPLFCFLVGLLAARMILWADGSRDPAACALVASFLAAGIMAPRNPARTVLRVIVWLAFTPYAAAALLTWLPGLLAPGAGGRPAWRSTGGGPEVEPC